MNDPQDEEHEIWADDCVHAEFGGFAAVVCFAVASWVVTGALVWAVWA